MSETLIVEKNKFIELFGIELFHQAISAFKAKARINGLSAAEHVVYNALRGHDYTRGFTAITNKVKLKNGMAPLSGLESAKYSARWMLSNKSLPALSALAEEQKKVVECIGYLNLELTASIEVINLFNAGSIWSIKMSNNIKIAAPDHHEKQMSKKEELRKKIKSFDVSKKIVTDTDEFFDSWCEDPLILDVEVHHSYYEGKECVEIFWKLEEGQTLKVLFFGNGIWKYDLTIYELSESKEKTATSGFSFYGKAYTYSLKDNEEESFIFYFDDYVQNKIQLKESFSKEYEGLVTIERSASKKNAKVIGNEIKYGWHTNYYDGPISGYVYKNKELHYFNEIEETLFKRQRVYAIYPLNLKQKLYAIYRHHLFEYVVHNKNKKIYDWYFGLGKWKEKRDKKRQELMKQPRKYLQEGKPIVGYFIL